MEMKTALALGKAGVDTEAALRRLGGNTMLYEKVLIKVFLRSARRSSKMISKLH